MSESALEWAERHALVFDYDLRRWVRVPEPGSVDDEFIDVWSRGTAQAWADDVGRAADTGWVDTLSAMLEVAARQPYTVVPDGLFMHLLTPPAEPPSPALASLATYPADEPLEDFAAELADKYRTDGGRQSSLEPTVLESGAAAFLVTAYVHADDGETLEIRQHVVWQLHEFMHAALTTGGEEIGRILQMSTDLLGLAAAVSLVERPG
jgi:hypothetical protein